MNAKQYDYKSLVQTYLDAHRPDYVHDDFKNYYTSLLAKLEQAFGIEFGTEFGTTHPALKMLFNATVGSYWSTGQPGDGFLEATLIYRKLEELNELGQQVLSSWSEVTKCAKQSRAAHLQMLYDLFVCMFGEVNKIVTSADLQSMGFDDTTEPNITNYFDYM